jgi:hypothetical protein
MLTLARATNAIIVLRSIAYSPEAKRRAWDQDAFRDLWLQKTKCHCWEFSRVRSRVFADVHRPRREALQPGNAALFAWRFLAVFRDAEETPGEEMICPERIQAGRVSRLCRPARHTLLSTRNLAAPGRAAFFRHALAVVSMDLCAWKGLDYGHVFVPHRDVPASFAGDP